MALGAGYGSGESSLTLHKGKRTLAPHRIERLRPRNGCGTYPQGAKSGQHIRRLPYGPRHIRGALVR